MCAKDEWVQMYGCVCVNPSPVGEMIRCMHIHNAQYTKKTSDTRKSIGATVLSAHCAP